MLVEHCVPPAVVAAFLPTVQLLLEESEWWHRDLPVRNLLREVRRSVYQQAPGEAPP